MKKKTPAAPWFPPAGLILVTSSCFYLSTFSDYSNHQTWCVKVPAVSSLKRGNVLEVNIFARIACNISRYLLS
ncbi:hypothetical protein ACFLTO_05670, partial [Chloroflexota bacterium]